MQRVPRPGSVTICEINRDLITAESLSDDRARETYGKVLGVVFSPVSFDGDLLLSRPERVEDEWPEEDSISRGLIAKLKAIVDPFKLIFHSEEMKSLSTIEGHGISWHPHKHILAFISGNNQITIRDYNDSECKEPFTLNSDSQKDIKCLEWRPNSGRTLSVACKQGGICIWSASYIGNAPSVRTGAIPHLSSISRSSGVRWILVDFLQSSSGEHITALSWSPNGRYLASASCESSSFMIWDIAQGAGTPIRRGLGGISMLKWSLTGDYFFTAKFDGTFYLWETNTWTSEHWSSAGGNVSGAVWDPSGRMILVSFSKSATLASIHFSSRPPSLDAHLVPVELPDLVASGSQGIENISWDALGERLAVSCKGCDDLQRGLVAVYDVRRGPLISASLVGFIRGPGQNPKPLAFAFNDKFRQGPLLSVCWSSGWCCTYPLLFRSHALS